MAVGKRWAEPTGDMQIAVDFREVTLVAQTLIANTANRMEYRKKMGLDGQLSNSFPLFCLSYWCLDRVREACGDPHMDHNPTSQVLPVFTLLCKTSATWAYAHGFGCCPWYKPVPAHVFQIAEVTGIGSLFSLYCY